MMSVWCASQLPKWVQLDTRPSAFGNVPRWRRGQGWERLRRPQLAHDDARVTGRRLRADGSVGKERTWAKSAQGSQSRSTGLSVGRTTALKHPWVSAARGSWRGTPVATPNTGCLEPTWSSWSPRRPSSTLLRLAERQGRWCLVEGHSTSPMGGVAHTP